MNLINGKGPYLNMTEAAKYCGYASRTFRDKVREYSIPRHGDEKNRFAVLELDMWMYDHKCFISRKRHHAIVRSPGGFTPVHV